MQSSALDPTLAMQTMAFRSLHGKPDGHRLSFRWPNGRMRSLPYSHLIETDYNPDIGIILSYVGHRVTIEGRNLINLYFGLEDEDVYEISARHDNEIAVPEDAPFVERIEWELI